MAFETTPPIQAQPISHSTYPRARRTLSDSSTSPHPPPTSAFSPHDSPSEFGVNRRSSFSSSDSKPARYPSRGAKSSKGSTLPSIRSLKSRFLGALGAGGGTKKGPRVVKGSEARKPIRVVSATVGSTPAGLKGFAGPAGAGAGRTGITRSASTPASLHRLSQPQLAKLAPVQFSTPLPVSVDEILSSAAEAERSPLPQPKLKLVSPPSRHQRAVSAPHNVAPAPRTSYYRSTPSHPPCPLSSLPSPLPLVQPVSAAAPSDSPSSSVQPPPLSLGLSRPISSDFGRRPTGPTLLALRAQEARNSLDVERSLSRISGGNNRHSRMLPGAALPASLAELGRSKSIGAPSAEDKRGRHWSAQPPWLNPPIPVPQLERASWQPSPSCGPSPASSLMRAVAGSSVNTRPPRARRHSVANGTPEIRQDESSPELRSGEKEAHRGMSLSQLLGQARSGLGFGGNSAGAGTEKKDGKERERRPSKPFPGGFEEVPYRSSIDASAEGVYLPQQGPEKPVSPTSSSPSSFARPLSFPDNVQKQLAEEDRLQRERETSFPDTPPPSAMLQHRKSDSSLRPSSRTSSRRPSLVQPPLPSGAPAALAPAVDAPSRPRHPRQTSSLVSLIRRTRSVNDISESPSHLSQGFAPPLPATAMTYEAVANTVDSNGLNPMDSPLSEMLQELRMRQSTSENPTRFSEGAPPRSRMGGRSSEDSDEDDDEVAPSPDFGRKDSQAGNPFLLAAYLDSPGASPALGKKRASDPSPYATQSRPPLPTTSSASFLQAHYPAHSPSPSASAAQSHTGKGKDRSLTLDQMEQEIARMTAELALEGRPTSFYAAADEVGEDTTPKAADVASFPSPQPLSGSVSPSRDPDTPSLSDLGMALPSSEDSELDSSVSFSVAGGSGASELAQITPRTARRWSILEIEMAYERMRRMLGSSASAVGSTPGSEAEGAASESGRAYAVSPQAHGQQERVQDRHHESSRGTAFGVNVENALEEALEQARGFTGKEDSSSSSTSDRRPSEDKPLPFLPPPRPTATTAHLTVSTSTTASSTPPTSLSSPAAHHLSLKTSLDSLAPPTSLDPSSRILRHHVSPSLDSLRFASSSGRRRKGSDASSTHSGIRKLVLPAANPQRLSSNATTESLRSLYSTIEADEDSTSHSGYAEGRVVPPSPARSVPGGSSTPISPVRRPNGRASSRLSSSGLLRSGVGKELQRRAGAEGEEGGDALFSPASASTTTSKRERERARVSVHRLVPPNGSLTEPSPRESRRRSGTARTGTSDTTSTADVSSWYPMTPSRARARSRSDSLSTLGSARRRHTGEEEEADEDSLAGGLEGSELMTHASLSMRGIRGMDKLEIFFKYTAVRADLEKAELERDALLDALRETRTTLSDIRRQRDSINADTKQERLLTRQVKQYLGGDPDRHIDQLDNLVESRQAWELRAKDALEELERTKDELEEVRRELVEGRAREEELERENLTMGAKLASSEISRSEYAGSPALRLHGSSSCPPHTNGLVSPNSRTTPTASSRHAHSSSSTSSSAFNRSESPTLTMSRNTSNQTAVVAQDEALSTPSAKRTTPARHVSKDSYTSSSSGIEPNGLGEISSPLMGQTISFGPKSSYGSNASPLKERSSPPTAFLHRGQFSSLRLPLDPSSSALLNPNDRLSKLSTASCGSGGDEDSEYADRSFDSGASVPAGSLGRLRERDEAFLADLTAEIPAGLEDRRGSE
ncbi:hypothetical protein JCM11641_001065 [Rhodosporidiobolus odoratus]